MDCNKQIYNRHTQEMVINPEYAGDEACESKVLWDLLEQYGGVLKLIRLGGPTVFPAELHGLAADVEAAERRLQDGVAQWLAARGVRADTSL